MAKIKNFAIMFLATLVICLSSIFVGLSTLSAETPIKVKSRLLMEYGTGQVLDEFDSKEHLPIASVTKLTTLLLAFEALEKGTLTLDKELIASQNASGMGGSQVFIDANSAYKVENLLHAIIISSANDACVMIAEEIAGSEQGFVTMMNEKVKSLGGNDTNYTNCSGLPSANAYSCANDVALVMREVLKYPLYFEISKIWLEDFEHPSGRITQMANTNKLLRNYTACDAGKTGSTNEAGFCMSATAKKGNMRLISVVLGAENSKDRFKACTNQFDWGFANFSSECLVDKNQDLNVDFKISMAKNQTAVRASEDYYVLTQKGEKSNLNLAYELYDVQAPISCGTVVGKIIISENNVVKHEIDIVTNEDVEAMSMLDRLKEISKHW